MILLLLACLCFQASPSAAAANNLVLINLEQLGWGDVGVYTPWRDDTPNIDKLARKGVVLDDLYCETSPTASMSTLLTGELAASWGLYTSNNGDNSDLHEDSGFILPDSLDTLATVLKAKSYATSYIGSWTLGQRPEANPLHFGYDSFMGTVSEIGPRFDNHVAPNIGFYRNEKIVARIYNINTNNETRNPDDQVKPGRSSLTQVYQSEADVFIRKAADKPFFLHMSLDALKHSPYRSLHFVGSSAESRGTNFTDALREVDALVGVVTKALADMELTDKTVVVLAAQSTALASHYNGGSNSPFTGETGDTTEGGLRVPAIIRAPGLSPGRSRLLMNLADLHATIRGLLGLTIPPCGDETCLVGGFNLAPALALAPHPPATAVASVVKREDAAVAEVEVEKEETAPKGVPGSLRDILPIFKGRLLMAIRSGRHKIHQMTDSNFVPGQFLDHITSFELRNLTKYPEIFDVVADPGERFFLGAGFEKSSSRHLDTLTELKAKMDLVLKTVNMTDGLLNECNLIWREWAPLGCKDLELCIEPPNNGTTVMCVKPHWAKSLPETVPKTVPAKIADIVPAKVPVKLPETVKETAPVKVNETLKEPVPETAEETVPVTVKVAVPAAVKETVPETVPETVKVAVPAAVKETVPETVKVAVPATVKETVKVAVPATVKETVKVAVPATVKETVPETVKLAVPATVKETVKVAVPATVKETVPATVKGRSKKPVPAKVVGSRKL